MNKKPIGKVFTSNPHGLKYLKEDAKVWQITRAGADLPNTVKVPQLSPSKNLFFKFVKEWKDKDPLIWWDEYARRFNKELDTHEKIHSLREIYKHLLLGQNIVLLCFCEDHRYCHRKLVGEFFEKYDVEVIELNPIKSEQITLF